jgi:hypothetical protein
MNLPVPLIVGNLLTSWEINSISKMNLSRREVHSASMDHAATYRPTLRCKVTRSEGFCCFFHYLHFSQHRTKPIRWLETWIREEEKIAALLYSKAWLQHPPNRNMQNSRESRCSKYRSISPSIKRTIEWVVKECSNMTSSTGLILFNKATARFGSYCSSRTICGG